MVPDKNSHQSGIGAIFIPTQAPETKPFLLTRTIGDKKTTEILLGYAERRLDRTDIRSIVELHHAMRIGMNLEAKLLNRIRNVETLLQSQLASTLIPTVGPTVQPAPPERSIAQPESIAAKRVAQVLAQSPFCDSRTLVIDIRPVPRSELRSILSDHANSIRRAIENPPELRAHGWGIRTGGAARFVDGNFVQTESHREVVNLYRDGELIVAALIYRHGLAWADKTDSRFHPLAFVEFVTNTLRFFRLVLADMGIKPQTLQVEIRLSNLLGDRTGTSLPAGPISSLGWTSGSKLAPSTEWSRTISLDPTTYEPARAAFLLLREVYVWFGHPEEAIPYTTGIGDNKVVDIEGISAIT